MVYLAACLVINLPGHFPHQLVYLAACLVIQPLSILHELYGVLARSFALIQRYGWPLAATAQTATVWIILLVTGDRWVAVCRPFEARWRSVERTRVAVIVPLRRD